MTTATVATKGRTTISAAVRDTIHFAAGDRVEAIASTRRPRLHDYEVVTFRLRHDAAPSTIRIIRQA